MQTILAVLLLVAAAGASHFRGAIMSWKPVGNTTEVEVYYRIAWRRSYTGVTTCTAARIQSKEQFGFGGSIKCVSGPACSSNIRPATVICSDFNIVEDWSTAAFTFRRDMGSRASFVIGYDGAAWLGTLKKGGGNWQVRTNIDTRIRADLGVVNTSPVTGMPAIIIAQLGCNNTISIPVNDADGDRVRCRWAEASKNECAGVCDAFPESQLDTTQCLLTIPHTVGAGFYAVAVVIEDFAQSDMNFSTPLSSVALQFLVVVRVINQACDMKAEFIPPSPANGALIIVPPGTTFTGFIVSHLIDGNTTRNQTGLTTSSPLGLMTSSPGPAPGPPGNWSVTVTWTPTANQAGPNIFCFTAIYGTAKTEGRCITFSVQDLATTTPAPTTTQPPTTAPPTTEPPTTKPPTTPKPTSAPTPMPDEPDQPCVCECNCKPQITIHRRKH